MFISPTLLCDVYDKCMECILWTNVLHLKRAVRGPSPRMLLQHRSRRAGMKRTDPTRKVIIETVIPLVY